MEQERWNRPKQKKRRPELPITFLIAVFQILIGVQVSLDMGFNILSLAMFAVSAATVFFVYRMRKSDRNALLYGAIAVGISAGLVAFGILDGHVTAVAAAFYIIFAIGDILLLLFRKANLDN